MIPHPHSRALLALAAATLAGAQTAPVPARQPGQDDPVKLEAFAVTAQFSVRNPEHELAAAAAGDRSRLAPQR